MSIGTITTNDSLANFFKAVQTARQRNEAAFEPVRPSAASEAPMRAKTVKTAPTGPQHRFYRPVAVGVNTAPVSGQQRTRILGNFFDAYA